MKTLSVEEAVAALSTWVDLALAGEQIQIRKGNAAVELRPAQPITALPNQPLSPQEALRRLQEQAHLTPQEADLYLREVREERIASEGVKPA